MAETVESLRGLEFTCLSPEGCRASVFLGLVTLGIMVRCLAQRRKLVCWNSTVKLNIVAPLVPASNRTFHQGGRVGLTGAALVVLS